MKWLTINLTIGLIGLVLAIWGFTDLNRFK